MILTWFKLSQRDSLSMSTQSLFSILTRFKSITLGKILESALMTWASLVEMMKSIWFKLAKTRRSRKEGNCLETHFKIKHFFKLERKDSQFTSTQNQFFTLMLLRNITLECNSMLELMMCLSHKLESKDSRYMSILNQFYTQILLRNITLVCNSMLGSMTLACCNKKRRVIGSMRLFTTINQHHTAPQLVGAADHTATKPPRQLTCLESEPTMPRALGSSLKTSQTPPELSLPQATKNQSLASRVWTQTSSDAFKDTIDPNYI